jgi:hypothetical protein
VTWNAHGYNGVGRQDDRKELSDHLRELTLLSDGTSTAVLQLSVTGQSRNKKARIHFCSHIARGKICYRGTGSLFRSFCVCSLMFKAMGLAGKLIEKVHH